MRAEGIVRVSRVRGREGDSFISPVEQADRITEWCGREGAVLNTIHEELDVSGGAELVDRPGLSAALESLEAGTADVIVVAYFDRLFRSTKIQAQVLERIEKAGGRVFALDAGEVTGTDNGQWLQAGFLGLIADYQRRQLKGRMAESQARAIARGVATWNINLPGYTKTSSGILEPDHLAPVVQEAFRQRANGATIRQIREYLAGHGIERSYHGVTCLLNSRVVLGELHFGNLTNLTAHQPIIDRDLFNQVQQTRVSRGPTPKSDRLLARLGVLRCGTCGARMVVATNNNSQYWVYRCPPTGNCTRRMSISATIAEETITQHVLEALGDLQGRAASQDRTQQARIDLDRAQADLDAALRAFNGLEDEPAAIERLTELRAVRDTAANELDHLSRLLTPAMTVTAADWPELSTNDKRLLIKGTIREATVSPGKGADRITVTLL